MDLTPYSTLSSLMGPLAGWLGQDDARRLQAYTLYEAIYDNVPETFKLIQRGDESNPIYLPSARTLVESKNRYLAKRWTYALDPKKGTDSERTQLAGLLEQLFKRERVKAKFATQKRYGLIRGDSVWHIRADEDKELGSRISLDEVDPGSLFPIEDDYNPEKITGVHLVDQVENDEGVIVIKRQTYRKEDDGAISYELSWWESGSWDDRDPDAELKPASPDAIPEGEDNRPVSYDLPPLITQIPVYHIKNNRVPGASFGRSELSGYETIIGSINQSMTDESLALALEGLGLYFTNSGPPVDDDGNETNWKLGPGWVVEGDAESDFKRVSGVTNTDAGHAHRGDLRAGMHEAAGIPDIAVGSVDVATAESGIALAFKMGPLLAQNEEKEEEILGVMDHLLYDLTTMWFPAYEQLASPARPVSIVDDPLPTNRAAVLKEVVDMLATDPPLISAEYARTILSEKLGYDFPDEMANTVVAEAAALATVRNVDPFASRVQDELETGE